MKVEESIYDKQFKTLRKGEWFEPTGFEHEVSVCGKYATTADVLNLRHSQASVIGYLCNHFEREEFINVKGDSVILWRSA